MRSSWSNFEKKKTSEGATPHLTMNLRQIVLKDGGVTIEQLVEYRNEKGAIVNTEWVEIPRIMEG